MNIITINCGSTTFKYKFFTADESAIEEKLSGVVENVGTESTFIKYIYKDKEFRDHKYFPDVEQAALFSISSLIDLLRQDGYIARIEDIDFFAYKIAHGGRKYYNPILIDEKNITEIEKYNNFAPSHNPNFIKITNFIIKNFPAVKNIFYFETVLHKDLELFKKTYAIPYDWSERYEIIKYGFHSAAHSYSIHKVKEYTQRENFKMISCHIGGGSSAAAIKDGKSFEISSGFSPQSGTIMASRPGDFDPYIVIYLLKNKIFTLEEIEHHLNNNSGMKGISGVSSDVRVILKECEAGNTRAHLAIDVFCYSIAKYIITYIGLLKGIDFLTFSGGIGENSPLIRQKICDYLDYFNIYLNKEDNEMNKFQISDLKSRTRIFKINTNEEYIVVKDVLSFVSRSEEWK